jgi:hypothetical protein
VSSFRRAPTSVRRRAIWGFRKDRNFEKATTTPMVKTMFDSIFDDQMVKSSDFEESNDKDSKKVSNAARETRETLLK